MTAKRLHAVRPAAKYAPYLGMQERIPGYMVSYQFPMSNVETSATDVRENEQLEGVFISELVESMEQAETTWREKVREVAAGHRAPPICESFASGGMQARWSAGQRVLAIGAFPREPMAPTVTDRVIYAVSMASNLKQPPGGTKITCPS